MRVIVLVTLLTSGTIGLASCTPVRPPAEAASPKVESDDGARVLVTPDTSLGRHLDVVGVLDFHTDADSQEKGFAELRR